MNKPHYMKRAQILTYVQVGIVTLCYVSLIAAVVVKFNGGRAAHIAALGLLGSALGFGSLLVGKFAKRGLEANPMTQLAKLLQKSMPSESGRPPPPLVAVTIRPVSGKDRRYAITLHNGSLDKLSNGSLDHSWLLHPGKFGLDDTHMPRDIWVQPPVQFDTLAPGADVSWEVDGYDVAPKYDGPKDTRVTVNATRVKQGAELARSEKITASVRMGW